MMQEPAGDRWLGAGAGHTEVFVDLQNFGFGVKVVVCSHSHTSCCDAEGTILKNLKLIH